MIKEPRDANKETYSTVLLSVNKQNMGASFLNVCAAFMSFGKKNYFYGTSKIWKSFHYFLLRKKSQLFDLFQFVL
jgi:hypothetical protein